MLEAAVIVARSMQYIGAAGLFGSSLFFVYALPAAGPASALEVRWARPLLAGAAVLVGFGSLLGLAAQASLLAGSVAEAVGSGAIGEVVSHMPLGKAAVVRAAAATAALVLLVALRPGRASWLTAACLGSIATASLAWLGHGAATDGPLGLPHLLSDVLHVLAAALWLGALAVLALLLLERPEGAERRAALQTALERFSGFGPALVAVVLLTGLFNAWLLVGPEDALEPWRTPYGRLLSIKLLLFVAMLGLAAANRWRLTPALGGLADGVARRTLKRTIVLETGAGLAILLLVAWLGTLTPPSAA